MPGDIASVLVLAVRTLDAPQVSHGAKVHCEVLIPVNHKSTGTVLTQVSLTKLFPRWG